MDKYIKLKFINKLYKYRFELFFYTQISVMFGSLLIPKVFFETYMSPFLFILNLFSGLVLISRREKLKQLAMGLFVVSLLIYIGGYTNMRSHISGYLRVIIYFLFYILISYEIIKQVLKSRIVGRNVIVGLISGYMSLGLIGFFICLSIEMAVPGSFQGLTTDTIESETQNLLYYSYITLLTIGYGDIYPTTQLAHKASMLIGLVGQIYLVVLSAIVVGKYINQNHDKEK